MKILAALRERLRYEPETGEFFWRKSTGAAKKGSPAGSPHICGYWNIRFKGKLYLAHRLAWLITYGEWPDQIDHINHDRLDNRLFNLRNVRHVDNGRNQKLPSNNTSGICGVNWDAIRGKWSARIKVDGVIQGQKKFDSLIDAAAHRLTLERKYNFHPNHGLD